MFVSSKLKILKIIKPGRYLIGKTPKRDKENKYIQTKHKTIH